ncbi:unnamed protein product [Symbiodinium natans]|uniref:Uncharacterized protein n=1 Tax=Symbiodinium natans TaxID=878477 RepID=A0A812IKI3_9DINO|nr:unnamed protein product [Symbiodinium natans]
MEWTADSEQGGRSQRDAAYRAVSQDEMHRTGHFHGLGTLPLVAIMASIAATFALAAVMLAHWLTPSRTEKPELTVDEILVDVTKQNGLTANVEAGVKFDNDMSNTLYNNNGAYSTDGDVKRINGAYDNNAESKHGHVTRANGLMDNNAIGYGDGDVFRQHGLLTGGRSGLLEDDELPPAPDKTDEDDKAIWKELLQAFKDKRASSRNFTQAKRILAVFLAMKSAASEKRKAHIMKVLNILFGPFDANETGGIDDSVTAEAKILSNLERRWLEDEVAALKNQRGTVDNAVQFLADNSDSETIREALNASRNEERLRQNLTRAELHADLAEVLKDLSSMPEDKRVHIGKIHIQVKEQSGLQANLGAGVDFSNKMPGSLHDNNNAKSDAGTVWRYNGAFDNNARSTDGNVLRVNGAFDNNAVTRNGSAQRQNGNDRFKE